MVLLISREGVWNSLRERSGSPFTRKVASIKRPSEENRACTARNDRFGRPSRAGAEGALRRVEHAETQGCDSRSSFLVKESTSTFKWCEAKDAHVVVWSAPRWCYLLLLGIVVVLAAPEAPVTLWQARTPPSRRLCWTGCVVLFLEAFIRVFMVCLVGQFTSTNSKLRDGALSHLTLKDKENVSPNNLRRSQFRNRS
jgi:hypothetical protein